MNIIEAILKYTNDDWEEALYMIQELQTNIRQNPNYLEDSWEDACDENERCYSCGKHLEYKEHIEYRGEYWGVDAYETVYEPYCENCGDLGW